MTRIKKALAIILALVMLTTVGAIAGSAAEVKTDEAVAADPVTNIVIHVRQDGLSQPYLYLWNSLPTNSAMSQS